MVVTPSIQVNNVVLDFPILDASARSLKRNLVGVLGGRARTENSRVVVRALDGVSFELTVGDRLGIVGPNGAGKTTLLRMLAGVFEPTTGSVKVSGRVASLLDLTAGFDIEATGYENVVLRSKLLGSSDDDISRITHYVEATSELGHFMSLPVRTFSSGMLMRLAFALATSRPADILLMDEWLAIGDADYLHKAEAIVRHLIEKSGILVFASHSEELIGSLCNKTLHMMHGRVVTPVG